ncbi:hypothetical protein R3P38DRAFT_2807230 [Favolaschia claudopus]|uniref:Uncharacterized protein n=1 Tax=Favolaschia claudopus TaxID=2862362 RepID=A0AAV9ZJ82_9AGAR
MGRPRTKLTQEQILARRAQAAWEYRQRHRAAVNEKARLRMRAHREKLRRAPADVQVEYAVKAAQYRRDYVECTSATGDAYAPHPHPAMRHLTKNEIRRPTHNSKTTM